MVDMRIGILWFTPETYARMREACVDRDKLPKSFEGWLERAEEGVREIAASGRVVVRVLVDVDEFVAFANRSSLDIDANARMQFAAFKAAQDGKGEAVAH